jgi:nucleoside-diphosphate-sugar epimerase
MLIDVAGGGSVRHVPWPPEKKAIDIGSFYADSSRFRAAVGWEPQVPLRDGFAKTLAYYRAHSGAYLDDPAPLPSTVA